MKTAHEVQLLLVEDNPRDAELTLRVLHTHHLVNNVAHVKDGQEALDWLFGAGSVAHTGIPKAIFLDLKLPKIDGLEVLRRLRVDERTRLLPVIMLTSSREERDVIESYKLGVNSYIVKPIDFESFSRAVAHAGHYWLLLNEAP